MENIEHLIDIYREGYNCVLDELKEGQDQLMNEIRTKSIEDLQITIKFEAGRVPTYEIKATYLPKNIFAKETNENND